MHNIIKSLQTTPDQTSGFASGLDPPRTRPNNLIPIYLPIIVILKSDAAVARVLNKIQVTPGTEYKLGPPAAADSIYLMVLTLNLRGECSWLDL
ncbi:hypothetical protein DCAR_0934498 [Daucus carota subsp. sativus]|uniref:Uncharacterized protein n=1 Tax=Daucus carota subsp. sativus TaxID=79200 RepID=A0A175YFF8_DAUCS|nr:hypothetical protein DCAR_0934498 [Daucus carota subsp. sativus]